MIPRLPHRSVRRGEAEVYGGGVEAHRSHCGSRDGSRRLQCPCSCAHHPREGWPRLLFSRKGFLHCARQFLLTNSIYLFDLLHVARFAPFGTAKNLVRFPRSKRALSRRFMNNEKPWKLSVFRALVRETGLEPYSVEHKPLGNTTFSIACVMICVMSTF